MIQFDKKFVYFMWDDKLKGKKVFFADTIDYLQYLVETNHCFKYEVVQGIDNAPFKMAEYNTTWRFCYYDPYYELKVAQEQGKTIQRYWSSEQEWEDYVGNVFYDDVSLYRIKPSEEKPVTCCELAQWLAKGSGEYSFNDGSTASTNYVYSKGHENNPIAETIRVRKWGDTEWVKPTREYLESLKNDENSPRTLADADRHLFG